MEKHILQDFLNLFEREKLLVDFKISNKENKVESITYDSNNASCGTLFFCKGAAFKKEYLMDAVSRGAVGYVSEKKYEGIFTDYIIVKDIRKAMACAAGFFYNHADLSLDLIGITGTKGKSTTAYYFKYIFDEYALTYNKKPCGIISTIDTYDGKSIKKSSLTTPEALVLHHHLHNAVESGLFHFVMEVSSQALKYDRVSGVEFSAGVFLNISEDHISPLEHENFEDYFSSKLLLFKQCKTAYINTDCDHFDRIKEAAEQSCGKVVLFGRKSFADYRLYDVYKKDSEIHFSVKCDKFDAPFTLTMPGLFNVENALAAIAVCTQCGIPLENIQNGLKKARTDGRMEIYTNKLGDKVAVIDYAHNKLSFEKLFLSMKEEYPGYTLISVFGCPGNKAFNRREELVSVAEKYCERIYITMDDPGCEDLKDICSQMYSHLKHPEKSMTVYDRGEAIHQAITQAPRNSVILITGKGNEKFQKIGNSRVPCENDAFFAERALDSGSEQKVCFQIKEEFPALR